MAGEVVRQWGRHAGVNRRGAARVFLVVGVVLVGVAIPLGG
jgi:hypothetical protein